MFHHFISKSRNGGGKFELIDFCINFNKNNLTDLFWTWGNYFEDNFFSIKEMLIAKNFIFNQVEMFLNINVEIELYTATLVTYKS